MKKSISLPQLSPKELIQIEEFFQEQFQGAVWRIGTYQKKTKSLEKAGEQAVATLMKFSPNIKKTSKILCLGAHAFNLGQHLASTHSCRVDVFCDEEMVSEKAFEQLNQFENPEKLELTRGSMTLLPYDWDTFDLILSLETLGFHQDKEKILRQIAYSLKPQAKVLFTLLYQQKKTAGQTSYDWGQGLGLITLDQYKKLARQADLERVLAKDMTQDLLQHYRLLGSYFQEHAETATQYMSKKTVTQFTKWLQVYSEHLEESNLGWGILQFQKRNV